jgi:hypothetical protein
LAKKKRVKVNFENPEAKMKLTVNGINAVDNALKIMKVFDDACTEIRKKEKEV